MLPLLFLYRMVDEAVERASGLAAWLVTFATGEPLQADAIPAPNALALVVGTTLVLGALERVRRRMAGAAHADAHCRLPDAARARREYHQHRAGQRTHYGAAAAPGRLGG